jgi:hypothetical protein
MNKIEKMIVGIVIIFIIASCRSNSNYVKAENNLNSGRSWLISKAGKAEINIDGNWEDSEYFAWGNPAFIQNGNIIKGYMRWRGGSPYSVEGVVNGKNVYLILIYGGNIYYTMIFEGTDNLLLGSYYDDFTKDVTRDWYPINIRRSAGYK